MKQLGKLPQREAEQIAKKLRRYVYPQLRAEPFIGPKIRKLRDYSPDTWRYRIGRFRVFYSIDTKAKIVFVLSIDLRRDAYR